MRMVSCLNNLFFSILLLGAIILLSLNGAYAEKSPVERPKCSPLSMLVLFNKNEFPDWDGIYNRFRKIWIKPGEVKKQPSKEGLSIVVGELVAKKPPLMITLTTSDKPIRKNFIDEAVVGTWWWRTAKQEISRQTGYVFILVAPFGKNCLQAHLAMTQLTSIILESQNAFGVHLISSEMVMQKALFQAEAKRMGPNYMPMMLWVKTYMGGSKGKDGKPGLMARTVGMTNFGHMEIETNNGPANHQYLLKMVWGLGSILALKGPVVADGHTFGRTQKERILVRHRKSVFGTGKNVYFIDFGR